MTQSKPTFDNFDLITDTTTGKYFATQSAMARLLDVPYQTISDYVNGNCDAEPMKLFSTKVHTKDGVKDAQLLNEDQILKLINHFNLDLLFRLAQAGLRVAALAHTPD